MAEYIKKIRTSEGDKQIDYTALANLPALGEGDGENSIVEGTNTRAISKDSHAGGYNNTAGAKGYYYDLTTGTKDEDVITLPYDGDYTGIAFPESSIDADGTITPVCGGWSDTFTLLE